MDPLITALQLLGFISVLGTEQAGFHGQVDRVVRDHSRKHDQNNGVVVVYDQSGAPWIVRCIDLNEGELAKLVRDFDLKEGAPVPHSNDGGDFFRTVIVPDAVGAA